MDSTGMLLKWVVDGLMSPEQALRLIASECGIENVEKLVSKFGLKETKRNVGATYGEWTQAEDAKIVKLWNSDTKTVEIAKSVDRTVGAVQNRLFQLKKTGVKVAARRPSAQGNTWTTGRKKKARG